ncbi:hypothetical protein [Enterocloster asparagiformis]
MAESNFQTRSSDKRGGAYEF